MDHSGQVYMGTFSLVAGFNSVPLNYSLGRANVFFVNGAATLRLIGPRSWTNPINPTDVNGNGPGTAADALVIINALAPRLLVDAQDNLVDPNTIDPSRFRFYDTNRDGRLTASDALFVINRIGREQWHHLFRILIGSDVICSPSDGYW